MEVKRVAIAKLKGANYNPPGRTRNTQFDQLVRSIAEIGLIQPILVDKSYNIIEGHRRVAAHKKLGWEYIEYIVYTGDVAKEQVYAQLNATSLKLTGSQNLQVYLKNPTAVTPRARSKYDRAVDQFGMGMLKKLAGKGMSLNVLRVANRVALYLDVDEQRKIRQIADWLILYRNSRSIQAYMETRQPARALNRLIEQKKPLRFVAAV